MADDHAAAAETLTWSVGGMDCAACATRIRGAVERLPGVSDVVVSVMAEKLTLRVAAGATAPEAIERTLKGLGYTVAPGGPGARISGVVLPADAAPSPMPPAERASADHGHDHGAEAPAGPWHATAKGRLVLLSGGLLALAWLLHFLVPRTTAPWFFALACVVGLVPIARRAFSALRAGQPFTIEGLMTVAGVGALLIGAAEEAALVVFLFAVGEVLEGVAANRARASIRALGALVPKTALVLGPDGGTRKVDAATLAVGDRVLVRPGDRIPADGVIAEGVSGIDESPVTGDPAGTGDDGEHPPEYRRGTRAEGGVPGDDGARDDRPLDRNPRRHRRHRARHAERPPPAPLRPGKGVRRTLVVERRTMGSSPDASRVREIAGRGRRQPL